MIAYTRTTDAGAEVISDVLYDIPHLVINSVRSKSKTVVYSKAEAVTHQLDTLERIQYLKLPGTTKVIVIPKKYLQDAQIQELLLNVRDVEWNVVDSVGHARNEYAYQKRDGTIVFKLRLMRNERTFLPEII